MKDCGKNRFLKKNSETSYEYEFESNGSQTKAI